MSFIYICNSPCNRPLISQTQTFWCKACFFMSMVEMVGATVRRASPGVLLPRLPVRSPSGHILFAGSLDLHTYGCAHIGFNSRHPHRYLATEKPAQGLFLYVYCGDGASPSIITENAKRTTCLKQVLHLT